MDGFSQGYCYSFESPKVYDKLLFAPDAPERQAIQILNPLGEDFSIMRTVSVHGLLTSLGTNYNHRNKSVKLYELGNVYLPKSLPLTELPDEKKKTHTGYVRCRRFFHYERYDRKLLRESRYEEKTGVLTPKAGVPYLHAGGSGERSSMMV